MEHARAGVLAAACQGWWSRRGARSVALGNTACLTVDVSRVEPGHDRLLVRFRARVRVGVGVRARIRVSITWLNLARTAGDLHGQTPRNQRLRRRRARSPEAATGRLVAGLQPGSAELPRAIRCALRRRRSRAGALPRGSNFDQRWETAWRGTPACRWTGSGPCRTFAAHRRETGRR